VVTQQMRINLELSCSAEHFAELCHHISLSYTRN